MTQVIAAIIKSWSPEYGVADQLRCAAMECQEDHAAATCGQFADAAETCGFNRKTAQRCWAFVKAQAK